MTLTVGSGPFGRKPAGRFNFTYDAPAHVLYLERSPRRVRVVVGGETVADTRDAKLLHETGLMPVYYLPRGDVRAELLAPSDHHTTCPFKGEASYHHVVVGDRRVEDAVWTYPEPNAEVAGLADHVAFYWDRVDHWYEEDEEVFVHPRDPYHRVDVLPTSRRVRVSLGGVVLAESTRTMALFETGLPTRWYLPAEDVNLGALEPSDTRTRCPYKGTTDAYWSARIDGTLHRDVAWAYAETRPAVEGIRHRICFYDEKVDVDLDGARQERPVTKFS